jgi:hypothetical protein
MGHFAYHPLPLCLNHHREARWEKGERQGRLMREERPGLWPISVVAFPGPILGSGCHHGNISGQTVPHWKSICASSMQI